MMSSTGPSTELVSRSSNLGWLEPKRLQEKASANLVSLDEVKALNDKVLTFDKNCVNYLKVLTAAEAASKLMTALTEADNEVAALKARFDTVKGISDNWVKKVDTLVK